MGQFVTYLRLSRDSKNGRNYGLDAQRRDLDVFLSACCPDADGCEELASYQEVETATDNDRPELTKAIAQCKATGATLLVARLDRLSRRVSFIASLLEEKGLEFKVASMPHADKFQLHIYSALAEQEREFISARTKAGLAAAKARGVKLGGLRPNQERARAAQQAKADSEAERLRGFLSAFTTNTATLAQIADALMAAGVKTPAGKSAWQPTQVARTMKRLGLERTAR
ncbi:recombinase family protein [Synechococcus sp. MU1643]|uniref:recombinase family protein n=1 Tax=Synechococcus sp. MU1643 TaxID=2508349 RepID=UPI001CF83BC3|nr:recombinase family protein [Synechococcus sp. MU1643]MCB4428490.1 recombinase family protein [Synechococcus sp. MU1643]